MVKRFGLVRTLNERLSRESISCEATHNEESEEPPGKGCSIPGENERLAEKVIYLTEQLVDCRSCLIKTQKELESLHFIKEKQFKALVSQLLAFESGLRRKQRELSLAISQRDRLIREQGHIIRFLAGKSGLESLGGGGNIAELRNEALAKIPVLLEEEEETHNAIPPPPKREDLSSKKLSCIIETGSEHDSDSAIILDDSSGSPSSAKRISRSVSDVVDSKEDEEEDECEESHLLEGSMDSLLHTKQLLSLSHKKVTKPRDLKNKNHQKRQPSEHPPSSPQTTTISRDNETGSVICSIFSTEPPQKSNSISGKPSSCA